jgi:glutathionylspermidine synthase
MSKVSGAWERIGADVRTAMIECGKESWAGIYDGVATKNKQWRPLRPPVMSHKEYDEVTGVTTRLADLILAACRRRAATVGGLRARLDVPAGLVEFLDEDAPLTDDLMVAVRPDVLMSGGVPKFVECNVDSALGGAFDSDGIARRFLAAYDSHGVTGALPLAVPESAVDTRFHAMRDQFDLADGATSVILFHMGSDYPDTQDGHTLIKLLEPVRDRGRAAGLDVVVHPLEWLTLDDEGRLCAGDTVLDTVLRMFIPQEVPHCPGYDALVTALGTGAVRMFTPSATWLLANKTTFAWLWEDVDEMSTVDAEVVRNHVPHTEMVTAAGMDRARERREDLVLKPAGTYGGAGVVVGREVTPERWDEALRAAVDAGGHLVQQYVPVDRLAMHFVEIATGDVREADVPYCVAPYLFGGRAAGAYLRFAVPDSKSGSVVNLGQGALTSGLLLVDG